MNTLFKTVSLRAPKGRSNPILRIASSFACGGLLAMTILSGCKQAPPFYNETEILMGTYVEVVSTDSRAGKIVFQEFSRLESSLSKYNPNSEISQLNKNSKAKVSAETFHLLERSKEFYSLTDGAFDITVGPLMDVWGFSNKQYRQPSEEEIKAALNLVGADKIMLDNKDFMVEFKFPGMRVDLGGIAKGYALDRAVEKLRQEGVNSCLINAGGQIYALGKRNTKPWKVAVRSPRSEKASGVIELENQSVSTSGDYEQYFVKDGRRFSHIMNPRTGQPVDSYLASVTVVASDGITADMLSTALFVLGKDKGEKVAQRFPGVTVKIIESN